MVEIIHLSPETARFMNDTRGLLGVYRSRNSDQRYNTAIDKYSNLYKMKLKGLLATDEVAA
jgi:hypothetical protein